jgi:hypothetical protein
MPVYTATVAQTLPLVSQAAVGTTTFFSALGHMTLNSSVGASFTNEVPNVMLLTERILYEEGWSVAHVCTINGTYTYTREVGTLSSMQLSGTPSFVSWTTQLTAQPFYINSQVSSSITVPLVAASTLSGTAVISITTSVLDGAILNGRLNTYGVFAQQVRDTLSIQGSVYTGIAETVSSSFRLDDLVSSVTTASEAASDAVVMSEVTVNVRKTFQDLSLALILDDQVTFAGGIANNTVRDTMYVHSSTWSKDFGAIAWVLNTETAGLTTYDNFGFNSLAEVNGVLYATSPEGVFAINGASDTGRSIQAAVKTGFLDFELEQTKRISDIFIGYTGGQLEFDVETYNEPQEVYTYAMEEREAGAPRNNRLKVGRGLSSRYWRFAIRNVDGADFQIYDVTAEVASSRRRL